MRERETDTSDEPAAVVEPPEVDVTLIDEMLSLTAEERLRQNDRMLRTIQELRDGFAARRADEPAGNARSQRR